MTIKLNIPDILRAARQDPELTSRMGACRYTSPCIIALGMTAEERHQVPDKAPIGLLIIQNKVSFPDDVQADHAVQLQQLFDQSTPEKLKRLIAKLEEKYL